MTCGNGLVELELEEWCDDGNALDGDGCSATCEVEAGYACDHTGVCSPTCGDGILTASEECDEGASNGPAYGQCREDCSQGPYCGDGVVDPIEECDEGALNGASGSCYFDCTTIR